MHRPHEREVSRISSTGGKENLLLVDLCLRSMLRQTQSMCTIPQSSILLGFSAWLSFGVSSFTASAYDAVFVRFDIFLGLCCGMQTNRRSNSRLCDMYIEVVQGPGLIVLNLKELEEGGRQRP